MSQSSLTIADFPNTNGWFLKEQDVFTDPNRTPIFLESLRKSRFVLCNPPFENFTESDRSRYQLSYVQKPAELLSRVLDLTPENAEIGFVLPYSAIDGHSYRGVRERIARRFAQIDTVSLPQGIFQKANFPTALLLARHPLTNHRLTAVNFSKVSSASDFLVRGRVDWTETVAKTAVEVTNSLAVSFGQKLWGGLARQQHLGGAVEDIARGVEWEGFEAERHISKTPRPGFLPGFYRAKDLRCFEPPGVQFLNARDDRRRNAWDKPWHLPKAICNAVRKSQGPWKIAACAVELNLLCTQNFTVLWPREPWTSRALAAVLNGPVACAYVNSHENWKHLKKDTLSQIPLPSLSFEQLLLLDNLVFSYERIARLRRDDLASDNEATWTINCDYLLMEIDQIVLRGYSLSSAQFDMLVDIFEDYSRPAAVQYELCELASPTVEASPEVADAVIWSVVEQSLREERV